MTQRRFGQRPEIAATWDNNAWDPQRFDVEDFAVAFVRFHNGFSLVLRASWAGRGKPCPYVSWASAVTAGQFRRYLG